MMFDEKTFHNLYKKLLAFYPREFREQFGESMEQTFSDLRKEQKRQIGTGFRGSVLWIFIDTVRGIIREHLIQIKGGKPMVNIISNQKTAAITGFILALPSAVLLLMAISDIELLNRFLKTTLNEADGYSLSSFGAAVIIGAFLLLPLGFVINFVPIARNMRAGNGIAVNQINLLLAIVLFIYIARLVIGFIVDQYPCWIGVPNCD